VQTNPDRKGIPQGSPISALLSNIYMMEFDEQISKYVKAYGGSYLRYCDDILLILPGSKESEAIRVVGEKVKEIRLEIQESKTEVCRFGNSINGYRADRPLQYLGFIFDGQNIFSQVFVVVSVSGAGESWNIYCYEADGES
jgi:hypothetical protein